MSSPIKVWFSEKMVADIGPHTSPSSKKPGILAKAIRDGKLPVQFIEPDPCSEAVMARAHKKDFVRKILNCEIPNGFGNRSKAVADSLPYTVGALCQAAVVAATQMGPTCALVSGFHHAGYNFSGGFCTLNGLMIAATNLLFEYNSPRVAIVDADYHYGNGTEDIIRRLAVRDRVFHYSFGKDFHSPQDAETYLSKMRSLKDELATFRPEVILYQAGADTHCDDPLGGVLSTEELQKRDTIMFQIARDLKIGIAWVLAGGYQRDPDGGISKVIDIHLNTFKAAAEVYSNTSEEGQ